MIRKLNIFTSLAALVLISAQMMIDFPVKKAPRKSMAVASESERVKNPGKS